MITMYSYAFDFMSYFLEKGIYILFLPTVIKFIGKEYLELWNGKVNRWLCKKVLQNLLQNCQSNDIFSIHTFSAIFIIKNMWYCVPNLHNYVQFIPRYLVGLMVLNVVHNLHEVRCKIKKKTVNIYFWWKTRFPIFSIFCGLHIYLQFSLFYNSMLCFIITQMKFHQTSYFMSIFILNAKYWNDKVTIGRSVVYFEPFFFAWIVKHTKMCTYSKGRKER